VGGRLFHWAENNSDCEIKRNGEGWLLQAVFRQWAGAAAGPSSRKIIFDVGANVGDFSAAVLATADRWQVPVCVLAFDPSEACQTKLKARLGHDGRFEPVPLAIAGENASRFLFSPAPGSGHASLVRREPAGTVQTETVEVVRLEDFLESRQMARIDFLKLDVEGAELAALRGMGDRLNPQIVPLIQFEYGGTTLDAGARLRDLFGLLESKGYRVAKLLPQAIEVRRYAPWMDHFTYANFVALARAGAQSAGQR
jgi:FkbM family methyltransferase